MSNLSTPLIYSTSAQLAATITDETGSGSLVFGTSPLLTTPELILVNSNPTADGSIGFNRSTEDIKVGDGTNSQSVHLGAWTAFTPSWTNLTVGNASVNAGLYAQIGKLLVFRVYLKWGSTTSISGSVSMTLPVTAATYTGLTVIAQCRLVSGGGGYFGNMTSTGAIGVHNVAGVYMQNAALSSIVPSTWTTNDEIEVQGYYESA